MARKLPGLQRVLSAPSLALVGYGEIGSSLYFALGVVAVYALGLTPWTLLAVGVVFVAVSLSYAEGVAAMPGPGGAAAFVRRAFNDPSGFVVGWVLFLDYLVVIALAALFVPHYLGASLGWDAITDSPWDIVCGIGVVSGLALLRQVVRVQLIPIAVGLTLLAIVGQLLLVGLGFAFLVSTGTIWEGIDVGTAPSWSSLVFAACVSALAFTGLETVANLAAEAREPGRTLPRSLFVGLGLVVLVTVAVALVGISAYPAHPDPAGPDGFASGLGTGWLRAPLVGIAVALEGPLPAWAADFLRVFVGVSGAFVLFGAVVTSIVGATRLAYSLAQRSMLPRSFARLGRRTAVAPPATAAAAAIASALLVAADLAGHEVRFLASLYSFGIFLAFTAAQIAVVRLRLREPELGRPFRVPGTVRIAGRPVPFLPLAGAALTCALWIGALSTHDAARIAGPIWLALGAAVYVGSRRAAGEPLLGPVAVPAGELAAEELELVHERILVPLKMGEIGEEVLATALKLAAERRAAVRVLCVIEVPLSLPLDAPFPQREEAAEAWLEEAREVACEHGVQVEGRCLRSRSIGEAIVEEAEAVGADLIVMGSSPRWRRWSRFFSPTVDHVLRRARCEVMVVTYPEGVLTEAPDHLESPR